MSLNSSLDLNFEPSNKGRVPVKAHPGSRQALPQRSHDICYVMGNGPSLRRLTPDQKQALRAADTFAFNHYPMHYESVEIAPTHYILIDSHQPTPEVLVDVPVILKRHDAFGATNIFLSDYWIEQTHQLFQSRYRVPEVRWPQQDHKVTLRRKFWASYHRWGMLGDWTRHLLEQKEGDPMTYAKLRYFWGWSTRQRLFLTQGTLTMVLNIVWLMGYQRVHLVGVDLNDGQHFYANDPRVDAYDRQETGIEANEAHGTTVWNPNGKVPPVQYILRRIRTLYEETGRELRIANPDSLPAQCGAIKYAPIPSLDAART